ncbi:hypothetical protein EDB81DRAFT_904555 [Dactylonectria macrodidyma]|uniref:Lysine-specific metallo-endopeptidase domain-containing protein n=1 Tax=Dactylonectria macrodidyma TaxID=307937 RepID=A0A9P9IRN7_9HYPO|nr:hypothetical protein EDB81DRAFT_904555 [Dactylonectria macrodidyma]
MAPAQVMARLAVLFLSLPNFTSTFPLGKIHPRQFSDVQGTPFGGFDGCSENDISDIVQAWKDVVELTDATFKGSKPGLLEQRIWGEDIGQRADANSQIDKVFQSVKDLEAGHMNGPIHISCKDVYQTNRPDAQQVNCANEVRDGSAGSIGGYAFSYGPNHEDGTIVLCPIFFMEGQMHLSGIVEELQKLGPNSRKDPNNMIGKAKMLLHELSHLPSLSGTEDVVVIDQYWNFENFQKIYGIKWVERFARSSANRVRTVYNADSYAWYATEKWYQWKFNDIPDAAVTPRDEGDPGNDPPAGPTKALNIILENNNRGVPGDSNLLREFKWLFFSVPFGTASYCKTDPIPVAEAPADPSITQITNPQYPHGTFNVQTQDGMCEYKNDGQGNPGALWCNGQGHSCRDHNDKDKRRYCDELSNRLGGNVEQVEMVVCEW